MNDSSVPFCQGLPGSMNAVSIADGLHPAQNRGRHELRTVVGPEIARGAVHADELRQHLNDPPRPDAAGDVDRQAFARELIDDREALQRPTVRARIEDEVVRPHVIHRRRRQGPRPARGDAASGPAFRHLQARPGATGDTSAPHSSRGRGARERSESFGTRTADTGRRARASPARPARRAAASATRTRGSTGRPTARRTRGGPTDRVTAHTRPAAGGRVRLPFFSRDLLEHVDLEIPVGHHLLQPTVFVLELPQALHIGGLRASRSASARRRSSGRSRRASSPPPGPASRRPPAGSSPSALP